MPASPRPSAGPSVSPWAQPYAPADGAQPLTAAEAWTREAVAPAAPAPGPQARADAPSAPAGTA